MPNQETGNFDANSNEYSNLNCHYALYYHSGAGRNTAAHVCNRLIDFLTERNWSYSVYHQPDEKMLNADRLVILGGDGTLNFVLNALPHIQIPILIIPCGTGNDWAHHLNGKRKPDDYFSILENPKMQACDAFLCNDRIVINGMGIGFDAEAAEAVSRFRFLQGWLSYMAGIAQNILFFKSWQAQVKTKDKTISKKLFMINIGNAPTLGGGYVTSPGAIVYDGILQVAVIGAIPIWKRILYLPKMSDGSHVKVSEVDYFSCQELHVHAPKPMKAHLDGELYSASSMHIRILPAKYIFIKADFE